ncbi:MAG: aconitate hydratase AcnA [Chloroflexota bacterium]|nr:MAG: aconitate hydratase AcnA [Chloroflexota bacterium]
MDRSSDPDPLGVRASLTLGDGTTVDYASLERSGAPDLARLPMTVKVLLENLIRQAGRGIATAAEAQALAAWRPNGGVEAELPFLPARVILQDFTGVPAIVDLAAMRDAMAELGGDPSRINPLVPADLVIDHSVQVDRFAVPGAFAFNVEREYERNRERYQLLRWAQTAFRDLRVVPPDTGIVHQVNLEYLASVVQRRPDGPAGTVLAFPDTLVGTDSHTTMVNGLGVLGYGVGGIEAEAVLLGQPLYQPMPKVVGVRLKGELPLGSTATDLVLVVTELLRGHGVVGAWVEFAGDGLAGLALADRATISNMSPEFGATATLFPIDDETLAYLRLTGRPPAQVDLVERYAKAQGLWRAPGQGPDFDEALELDLSTVQASVAGPKRPQDRVPLTELRRSFRAAFPNGSASSPGTSELVARQVARFEGEGGGSDLSGLPADQAAAALQIEAEHDKRFYRTVPVELGGERADVGSGSVVIAAITSCTNTSNPTVMVGAGLLARNAVARGLRVGPAVKTSLAPGSQVVTRYLERAGLMAPLETLGFSLVGYGCTTCIGNSGPLDEPVAKAIEEGGFTCAAVLSGNRNFEGRIHPLARASYLASPPLVVAFALAGRVDIDLTREPLGHDPDGRAVFLADLWPSPTEVREVIGRSVSPDLFRETYASLFEGDERWQALPIPAGARYAWDASSTYIARPTFLTAIGPRSAPVEDIVGARVLALLGDSVTTDHISPAGSIPPWSPAGQWLQAHGVAPLQFNSYGSRRGQHEVMVRGTFGNIRLRNALAPEREGPYTTLQPGGEPMFLFDAAMRYVAEGVPLLVIAGREYGSGSSRDWAAKGTALLGVRAVLAESYERIHRSNLVGMGVLPLQFLPGQSAASLGLEGTERYDVVGPAAGLRPHQEVTVRVTDGNGRERSFRALARLDGAIDVDVYRHGGILPAVLRTLAASA